KSAGADEGSPPAAQQSAPPRVEVPESPPPEPIPAAAPAPVPLAAGPAPAVAADVEKRARSESEPTYGMGARIRYITIPGWFLGAFTDQNVPLNSASFAAEFVRRRGDLDLVGSFDVAFMSPSDGNWLGKGKNPLVDTDFVQFRSLNFISLDVSLIWHHAF